MAKKSIKKYIRSLSTAILNKKARRKAKLTRGQKISQTKQTNKAFNQKFPVGLLVRQKYYPRCIGVVASTVKTRRSMYETDRIYTYVDVLWIANSFYGDGTTSNMSVTDLVPHKEKKVLES